MKRIIALFLMITLLATCAVSNAASSYTDLISSVLDSMNQNNKSASGAPQQTANGSYRAVEMLTLMAYRLDSSNSYTEIIDSAIDTLNANNKSLSSAPQQTANGLYRCVELLAVIGLELDSSGKYREFIPHCSLS